MSTLVKFKVGNIVFDEWSQLPGVVLEVDHENARLGGAMNYKVAILRSGRVDSKLWYPNGALTLIDDGTAESE